MQTYLNSIAEATKKFQDAFKDCTAAQINWKPNPDSWSIGQIMDHIIITNETYYSIFSELRAGTYRPSFTAKIPFFPNLIGNLLVNSVKPSTSRKQKTVPVFEPNTSEISEDILPRFIRHQAKLEDFFRDNWDLVSTQIIIGSPANRNLVYSTQHVVDLITWHEHRHFDQALQVWEAQQATN